MRWFFLVLMVVGLIIGHPSYAQDTATPIPVVVTVVIVWPTHTETPTPTFTPEPTEGPSPTPTATATPTPYRLYEATVEVDGVGQDVAFVYEMDAGQLGTILFLAFIAGLFFVDILLRVRR